MNKLLSKSSIFKQTGGTRISGFSDGEQLISHFEDISRRSSIQKAIGNALIKKYLGKVPLLLTTARINEEITKYARRAGVKIIASHSAPTDRAIERAELARITLVGF